LKKEKQRGDEINIESRDWLTKVAYGADEAIDWLEELEGG
jgi:hypothetical protein